MALFHFLLIYDLSAERLVRQEEYADADEAVAAYATAERQYRGRNELEIVLVGADSLDTIRQTHAHYFDAVGTPSVYLTGA